MLTAAQWLEKRLKAAGLEVEHVLDKPVERKLTCVTCKA